VRRQPDRARLEKYFHSRGAASYEEGRFDSAIRFFRKALALEDLHYIRHHLALSYLGKNDLDRALLEMSKAVELAPSVAEYYDRRAAMLQMKGDRLGAEEDYREACLLDANYARIGPIRAAAKALHEAFGPEQEEGGRPEHAEVRDEGLRNLLQEANASIEARRRAVERRSCILECPAYCCHFKGEPVLHGLFIGPWKLEAIRRFLKAKGLREEDFLGRLPCGPEEKRLRLIPPHMAVLDRAERVVFYPKRSDRLLAPVLVPGLPMSTDYRELSWITAEARACIFLDKRRCIIHDLGGEAALPACKEFLCLTGYVFVILDWLKVALPGGCAARPMEELNKIALEALLLLSDRLFGNEPLHDMEKKMESLLRRAVEADRQARVGLVKELTGLYRSFRERHGRLFSRQKKLLQMDLAALFPGP